MERLLHSGKFMAVVVDAGFSTILLLAARYLSPGDADLIKQLVVIYQPVFITLIAAIAAEDISSNRAMQEKP